MGLPKTIYNHLALLIKQVCDLDMSEEIIIAWVLLSLPIIFYVKYN